MIRLLTKKDFERIERAKASGKIGLVLARSMKGAETIWINIAPGGGPWPVEHLIRLETYERGVYTSQYFDSVKELRKYGPKKA